MKIQLIVPSGYQGIKESIPFLPTLGVGYVASAVEAAGHQVSVIDNFIENLREKEIIKRVAGYGADIVGLSFGSENRFEAFSLSEKIKKVLPDALVVAGGPHPTLAAEDMLKNIGSVDIAVIGEGEEAIVDLINLKCGRKEAGKIEGVAYRDAGKIKLASPRRQISDLDSLPYPARHLFGDWPEKSGILIRGKSLRIGHLMTSRGCVFKCNFCSESRIWQNKIRFRSPESVVGEIRHLVDEWKMQAYWFYDSVFTTDPRRVIDICDLIIKRGLVLPWRCNIRVDNMSKELLAKMKEAGCYLVGLGVESGSDRILKEVINKRINTGQVRDCIRWCKELDIIPHAFFVLSHPTEGMEEARLSIDLMKEFYVEKEGRGSVGLGIMRIYPGTDIEKKAHDQGILPKDYSWTKRYKDLESLPMQGDVPVYTDRLSMKEMSGLIFQWQQISCDPFLKRIPYIFRDLLTFRGLIKYFYFGLAFIKVKLFGIKD
ncbi:MAG: B12-binding domain-containing radical SAM protein [Endomicrobiales bacterium]|nr:B12-binding domain-containing radical SAM protein [Endomicrobiales bacterium]